MENNILELLIKMMMGGAPQQHAQSTSYPQDNFVQTQNQNLQNNLLPLVLSLLNKNSSQPQTASKTDENKKAEVTSASSDEILL